MRGELYQIVLIALGVATAALFGAFFLKELYPEYKIYQKDYIALEEFRSSYTGEPPPPFVEGIQQIVLKKADKGPETIDRCTSCHVALKFEHFSPTKIAYDAQGKPKIDADGFPIQVPNPDYIWASSTKKLQSCVTKSSLPLQTAMNHTRQLTWTAAPMMRQKFSRCILS